MEQSSSTQGRNIPFLYKVEVNQLISPAHYSSHASNVGWVQHIASVDERKHLETGAAGERYKPVCNVDRPLFLAALAAYAP